MAFGGSRWMQNAPTGRGSNVNTHNSQILTAFVARLTVVIDAVRVAHHKQGYGIE